MKGFFASYYNKAHLDLNKEIIFSFNSIKEQEKLDKKNLFSEFLKNKYDANIIKKNFLGSILRENILIDNFKGFYIYSLTNSNNEILSIEILFLEDIKNIECIVEYNIDEEYNKKISNIFTTAETYFFPLRIFKKNFSFKNTILKELSNLNKLLEFNDDYNNLHTVYQLPEDNKIIYDIKESTFLTYDFNLYKAYKNICSITDNYIFCSLKLYPNNIKFYFIPTLLNTNIPPENILKKLYDKFNIYAFGHNNDDYKLASKYYLKKKLINSNIINKFVFALNFKNYENIFFLAEYKENIDKIDKIFNILNDIFDNNLDLKATKEKFLLDELLADKNYFENFNTYLFSGYIDDINLIEEKSNIYFFEEDYNIPYGILFFNIKYNNIN